MLTEYDVWEKEDKQIRIRADIDQREMIPRCHLPVEHLDRERKVRYYFYPLALVILPWKILYHASHIFWRDLFYWNEEIKTMRNGQ